MPSKTASKTTRKPAQPKFQLVEVNRSGGIVKDGENTIKLTASALRVFQTIAESKRPALTRKAAEVAASDDRQTRGRVWDGHFAIASGKAVEIRPGVCSDEDVSTFLKELGIRRAAVTSPKPQA